MYGIGMDHQIDVPINMLLLWASFRRSLLPVQVIAVLWLCLSSSIVGVLSFGTSAAESKQLQRERRQQQHFSRRSWLSNAVISSPAIVTTLVTSPSFANAMENCVAECVKECSFIAPGEINKAYCQSTCADYCKNKESEGSPSGKNDVVRQDLS